MKEKELRTIVRKIILESDNVISMDRFQKGRIGIVALPKPSDIENLLSTLTSTLSSLTELEEKLLEIDSFITEGKSNLEGLISIFDMYKNTRNPLSDLSLEAIKVLVGEAEAVKSGCNQINPLIEELQEDIEEINTSLSTD